MSILAASTTFTSPPVEFGKLSPMLIAFGTATAGVLVEAFAPREHRYRIQVGLSLLGLAVAFAAVIGLHNSGANVVAQGSVAVDGTTLFLQGTILVIVAVHRLPADLRAQDRPEPGRLSRRRAPRSPARTPAGTSGYGRQTTRRSSRC